MNKDKLEEIGFGPVYIKSGIYNGMIGNYDDDEVDQKGRGYAVVYRGLNLLLGDNVLIPHKHLTYLTTEHILLRQKEIFDQIVEYHNLSTRHRTKEIHSKQVQLLNEFILTEAILHENYIKARFLNKNSGKKLFISHSSKDKLFAKTLATDLSNEGHIPWLDEWDIKVGDSIPSCISKALRNSDFILVVLSEEATNSHWVQAEWEIKYWDEISEGKVKVLTVMYKSCEIPELLKTKKYADFSKDYNLGLQNILYSIK